MSSHSCLVAVFLWLWGTAASPEGERIVDVPVATVRLLLVQRGSPGCAVHCHKMSTSPSCCRDSVRSWTGWGDVWHSILRQRGQHRAMGVSEDRHMFVAAPRKRPILLVRPRNCEPEVGKTSARTSPRILKGPSVPWSRRTRVRRANALGRQITSREKCPLCQLCRLLSSG